MNNKGKVKYVPPNVLDELNNIKTNYNITSDARAFEKMAEFVPLGMELDRMRKRLLMIDIFEKKKK